MTPKKKRSNVSKSSWKRTSASFGIVAPAPGCIIYPTVSVSSPGYAGYKLCYQEVLKVVKGIIHQPYELQDSNVFYAFSYYFDRAVDAGLIGEHTLTHTHTLTCLT